jgi:quaternary ammonium compound-resistance protein SugE
MIKLQVAEQNKKQKYKAETMNWIMLMIAGLFEVGFATCLGKANQATTVHSRLWWMGGFLVCLSISMYLLYKVTQSLPIGTAYAVWTGIGAVGTVLIGIFFFKEPATFWRIFFLFTLISSIIGLKIVSTY